MNAKKAAAMISIQADAKGLDRGMSEARKKLKGFGSDMKKIGGKIWGGAKGLLGTLGLGGGIGTVLGLGSVAGDVLSFEKSLTRLQIAMGRSGPEMAAIRSEVSKIAKATGLEREQVLASAASYVALTGDAAGAAEAMATFAKVAVASGSATDEVATSAAALKDSLAIDPKDFEAAFSALIQQGKSGAVELKDFAGELSSVAPQFQQFGVSGVQGLVELGASIQVVKKNFANAGEAANGLRALMSSLVANADRFEKAGVKIFTRDPRTGAKNMRALSAIWQDISSSKLVKDPTLLAKAFGRDEARRAFEALSKHAGLYDELIAAGQDAGAVQRDFATYMESDAAKLETKMNELKVAIADAFTPERIKTFVSLVEAVADRIGKVIDGLSELGDMFGEDGYYIENPFEPKDFKPDDSGFSLTGLAGFGGLDTTRTALERQTAYRMVRAQQSALPGAAGEKARSEIANSDAFRAALGDITGAGTREERIRRAVSAVHATPDGALGADGKRKAGEEWLKREGISQERIDQVRYGAFAQQMADKITQAISKGFAGVSVKMDSSEVSKAVDNARVHRGG